MNTTSNAPVEFLTSPWATAFYDLVSSVQEDLLIASPFLGGGPLRKMAEIIKTKQSPGGIKVSIVTNLAIDSLTSGSLDITALLFLAQSLPGLSVTYLPSLHAKIYVADTKTAVVTSGNLTNNGLVGNHEYGVLLQDPALVSTVRGDLSQYALLGNTVSLDTLIALDQAAQELKTVRQQADKSIKTRIKTEFEQRAELAKLELLKARARNKTTHGIFCDTILYLLERHGPLKTIELHPLIQQIHPDLCDDAVDRVIDDVHFGKKWKHYVRMAQVGLRRRGKIALDKQHWKKIA